MEKKIKVTNIDWDIDEDDFISDDIDLSDYDFGGANSLIKKEFLRGYLNLPTEEEIVVPEDDDDEDYIADYLSDKYGYCINGFEIED